MAKRKKGMLSPDDESLWQAVLRTVTPLDRRGTSEASGEGDAPEGAKRQARHRPPTQTARPQARSRSSGTAPEQMNRADWRRVANGKIAIGRRIDLHGHDRPAAHRLVDATLKAAQEAGVACVLIVTGKGRTSPSDEGFREGLERGVLRRELPHWLGSGALRQIVRAYAPAHQRHGGSGAWYVLLRRKRPAG